MESLLLCANRVGVFGAAEEYPGGCVREAGFVYLEGEPSPDWLEELPRRWGNRMFICLSRAWEDALTSRYPQIGNLTRYQMTLARADRKQWEEFCKLVPEGLRLAPFDEAAFAIKPFGHGANYADYADFARRGSGAVVWDGSEAVASASSYLTFGTEVELDISTRTEYRRRHLALACAAKMLLDCEKRGLCAHWDAQNLPSKALAEKLGYVVEEVYTAYAFLPKEAYS